MHANEFYHKSRQHFIFSWVWYEPLYHSSIPSLLRVRNRRLYSIWNATTSHHLLATCLFVQRSLSVLFLIVVFAYSFGFCNSDSVCDLTLHATTDDWIVAVSTIVWWTLYFLFTHSQRLNFVNVKWHYMCALQSY